MVCSKWQIRCVSNHKYSEADIVSSKDGTGIGTGRLIAGGFPSIAAIDIRDSTYIDEAIS